jgi:hypothetical protein
MMMNERPGSQKKISKDWFLKKSLAKTGPLDSNEWIPWPQLN